MVNLQARQKKEFDVYLLIGQSNMAGRGQILEDDEKTLNNVYLLDDQGKVVPASVPLNRYSSIRKGIHMQQFSLGCSFSQEMAKKSKRKILLVVQARGNTNIESWLKNAGTKVFNEKDGDDPELWGQEMPQFFSETIRRSRQAMKYGKLKGILWHQGEADSRSARAQAYVGHLACFVADLRSELGLGTKVPFVMGEVYRGGKAASINKELNKSVKVIPNSYCVSSEDCPANSDNVHFSREGCIIMGQRYADVF